MEVVYDDNTSWRVNTMPKNHYSCLSAFLFVILGIGGAVRAETLLQLKTPTMIVQVVTHVLINCIICIYILITPMWSSFFLCYKLQVLTPKWISIQGSKYSLCPLDKLESTLKKLKRSIWVVCDLMVVNTHSKLERSTSSLLNWIRMKLNDLWIYLYRKAYIVCPRWKSWKAPSRTWNVPYELYVN